MQHELNQLVRAVLGKGSLSEVSRDELLLLTREHPYSSILHFLHSRKLQETADPRFAESVSLTALYFNNPHWLNQQLRKKSPLEELAEQEARLQPDAREIPPVETAIEIAEEELRDEAPPSAPAEEPEEYPDVSPEEEAPEPLPATTTADEAIDRDEVASVSETPEISETTEEGLGYIGDEAVGISTSTEPAIEPEAALIEHTETATDAGPLDEDFIVDPTQSEISAAAQAVAETYSALAEFNAPPVESAAEEPPSGEAVAASESEPQAEAPAGPSEEPTSPTPEAPATEEPEAAAPLEPAADIPEAGHTVSPFWEEAVPIAAETPAAATGEIPEATATEVSPDDEAMPSRDASVEAIETINERIEEGNEAVVESPDAPMTDDLPEDEATPSSDASVEAIETINERIEEGNEAVVESPDALDARAGMESLPSGEGWEESLETVSATETAASLEEAPGQEISTSAIEDQMATGAEGTPAPEPMAVGRADAADEGTDSPVQPAIMEEAIAMGESTLPAVEGEPGSAHPPFPASESTGSEVADAPSSADASGAERELSIAGDPSAAPTPAEFLAEAATSGLDELVFEPIHTVDYFASQGIQLKEEENPDPLARKMRSFTEWLKTMKRLHPEKTVNPMDTRTEEMVMSSSERSNAVEEVITESMAMVFEKQGRLEKALDIYQKLCLIYPARIDTFAPRIQSLKDRIK